MEFGLYGFLFIAVVSFVFCFLITWKVNIFMHHILKILKSEWKKFIQ